MRNWIIKMAWRDSRRGRSKLFLFISAISLGIAALVAISSFGENLQHEIDRQAATLIGADLKVSSRKPLDNKAKNLIDSLRSLSTDGAEEIQFASMVLFTKNGGSRLVQIRALDGKYPFYGVLETIPERLTTNWQEQGTVLVDQTLLLQFDATVGDTVQLGAKHFRISGALTNSPGQTAVSGTVAPTIFMPLQLLAGTGLTQKGSRINRNYYFQLKKDVNADALVKKLEDQLDQLDLRTATISSTKENTGRSFADLNGFLGLVGFIALLLGCLGVASAVHIYVKEKLISVAVLRCLGASNKQTFFILLVQIVSVGFFGGLIGACLGIGVQQLVPWVLSDFLPIEVNNEIAWRTVITGTLTGLTIAVLFALIPLLSVRKISPLNTLRVQDNASKLAIGDPLTQAVIFSIICFIVSFARIQLQDWIKTLGFCVGVLLAFIILYGIAKLLMRLLRRYIPLTWPYVWRQGLANLYRPNNQTITLMIAIGLSTAFIASLFFIQDILLNRISLASSGNQPNMVLFDIQSRQQADVLKLTRRIGLPVLQQVPVVTMQLTAKKGYTAEAVRKDSTLKIPLRGFGGEIRATYRDSLMDSEKITKGKWQGKVPAGDTALISLDEHYAERIGVTIGDHLLFNVQGVSLPAIVGSFRAVDWNRMQTNFRVVFPKGVIDGAPQFHVIMTRTPNEETTARFQQLIVKRFPNVSIIDLNLILRTLDELLDKIRFVIQFIGAFSILTGLVVLIASVMMSKYQRIKENVLLRTVGASKSQLLSITACEYCLLGLLAAITGILLAILASFLLARFVFEASFSPSLLVILLLILAVSGLTVLIGVYNSLSAINQPPLAVLRKEN